MKVPFLDLRAQYRRLSTEIEKALREVLESGHFILGPKVRTLEETLACYLGVKHTVGVASGSDALVLALMALGVGEGDEVITTPFTFFATVGAILRVGAKPVFADIDPETFNIDPATVKDRVTERTRAILPVHLFGQCADMAPLLEVASRWGLRVVEDAAQAIGAVYAPDGLPPRRAGGMGDLGCFSFYPTKNLGGAGDGGLVSTDDDVLAERVRILRVHGAKEKYLHELVGVNSRLDELQAAVLLVKFSYLEEWTRKRRENAHRYDELLREIGAEEMGIKLPKVKYRNHHVFHQYVIRTPRRDDLRAFLWQRGIGTEVYYPIPLHLQPCLRHLGYREGELPEAERAAGEVLALPIYPELHPEQQEYVVEQIAQFFRGIA